MSGGGPLKVALVALNQPGYRSLALGYLRAYAEADERLAGKVAFLTVDLDTTLDPWLVAFRVAQLGPDVVAFSVMCWNAEAIYHACDIIGRIDPKIVLVLGGPEVGPIAERVAHDVPCVSAIVRGEGEETFAELLHILRKGKDPTRVPGVTARRKDEVVSAPDRPLIDDLDSIPSPYLSGVLHPIEGATYLETYRGCAHHCGYCFEGKNYGRLRFFSEERVEAEVALIASTPGLASFSFVDPVFNLTDKRLEWLSNVMAPYAARGTRLHTVEVDIERIGSAQASLMKRAGVVSVETGPQSVGRVALETCRRRFDPERFATGVQALKAEGIRVECDLIIGLPGDTPTDVLDGFCFVLSKDPGKIQCSSLRVLPGTDLWARADELGLSFDQQPPHEVVSTPQMSFADLRRLEVMGFALQEEYAARLQ